MSKNKWLSWQPKNSKNSLNHHLLQSPEELYAPSLPCLLLDMLVCLLGFAQELFQRSARHVLGYEDDLQNEQIKS